ncbi:MAG TPA: DUF2155 domain-containing protein [Caulobacteraceae bacterium]|nr:DUF2155 domain-containing protein [Caulobacteraceae bacterium]
MSKSVQIAVLAGGAFAAASLALATLVQAQPTDQIGEVLRKGKAEEAPPAPADVPKKVTGEAAAAVNAPAAQVKVAPASATNAPAADAKAPPDRRPRFPVAILQALDKVTAQSMRFEAPVGQPVRYGNLVITVRDCETTTADEPAQDAVAYVEVQSQAPNPSGNSPSLKQVFKGWMFADSPSVNPMQHPVYDAWLIACKA